MQLFHKAKITFNRNLTILFACQAVGISGAAIVTILGGIVGTKLTPYPNLATLPVSLMIIGLASATVPASFIMKRFGRRAGSAIAAYFSSAGALLAAYGIMIENFFVFCVATAFIGAHGAFVQQYRFAAAESVSPDRAAFGISTVLFGSVFAGFLGPEIVKMANGILDTPDFAGPLVILAGLYLAAGTLLIFLRLPKNPPLDRPQTEGQEISGFKLSHLVLAVAASTVAYGIMTLVMTATPISMHVLDGFSIEDTAFVIQAHIIAMYFPSLFTGLLIKKFGGFRIMLTGAGILIAAALTVFLEKTLLHYFVNLFFLGLGWNFLFISGTALLVKSSPPQKRFRLQALNEFSIFGTAAAASLLGGALIHYTNWTTLNLLSLPLLVTLIIFILAAGYKREIQAKMACHPASREDQ